MRKRSRKRRPKRTRPRDRSQLRQRLSKEVQGLYEPDSAGEPPAGDEPPETWEDELHETLSSIQPRGGGRRVGPAEPPEREPPELPEDEMAAEIHEGMVVEPWSGACRVESRGRSLECVLPSRLAVDQQRSLAVGDRVRFALHGAGDHRIVEVLPRRAVLSRPDPRNPRRERVIAANVDVVVQVVSFRRPPLRPALIDRCLIAIERGGARGLICANKVDLLGDEAERRRELAALEPYRELGLTVIACSARTGEGLDAVRRELAGSTAAFVGHSGVGKSSLLNALAPDLDLRTSEVSGRGRGRHTTTRSCLHDLGDGIRVVDTPGIREFGLFELDAAELPAYFPEFEAHAAHCRFNDCRHVREPDCAVRAAVERQELRAARYATYRRILESLLAEGPG